MPRPRASTDPFYAVADPTRRAILDRLRAGNAPVAALAAGFAMSRPAVSKHLRVLRDARLVRERRGGDDGRQRVDGVSPAPLRQIAEWAATYEAMWPGQQTSLKSRAERRRERKNTSRK